MRCCFACTCGIAIGRWIEIYELHLAARETLRGIVSLRMPKLARNCMGKISIMLQLVVVLMTSCVGRGVRENPYPSTTRNATYVDKDGDESLRCLFYAMLHAQARVGAQYPACDIWREYEAATGTERRFINK